MCSGEVLEWDMFSWYEARCESCTNRLPSKNIANYKKTLDRADVVKKRVDEGLVMVLEEVSHVANRTVSGSGVGGVVSTLADARTEAADLMGRMVSSAEVRSPPQARVDVTRRATNRVDFHVE